MTCNVSVGTIGLATAEQDGMAVTLDASVLVHNATTHRCTGGRTVVSAVGAEDTRAFVHASELELDETGAFLMAT